MTEVGGGEDEDGTFLAVCEGKEGERRLQRLLRVLSGDGGKRGRRWHGWGWRRSDEGRRRWRRGERRWRGWRGLREVGREEEECSPDGWVAGRLALESQEHLVAERRGVETVMKEECFKGDFGEPQHGTQ